VLESRNEFAATLVARIERLPVSSFHVKVRIIMGAATFFDAFGVFTIGYVLPVLAGLFKLSSQQVGYLISSGFAGMAAGAIFFGWLAERIGKVRAITYAIGLFAVTSLLAALSWNLTSLLVIRTIQGIGLGGEVPIAAAYVNEIARAKERGRFFMIYELMFPVGLVGAGLLGSWLVPRLGWQVMFLIGGLPAVLAFFLTRILPETPRWLLSKGRFDEAEKVVEQMERIAVKGGKSLLPVQPLSVLPASVGKTSWLELFQGIYRMRTFIVWGLWITAYFIVQSLGVWMPTIYRTVYKLSVADALRYGLILNLAQLLGDFICAMLVDLVGRRKWFIAAFLFGSAPFLALWWFGAKTPLQALILTAIGTMFTASNAMLVYLYTPEIYPTRLRSLGTGTATAWLRVATASGSAMIGFTLANHGVSGVFLLLGLVGMAGAAIALGVTETRGLPLEEISP
jgi:MFS transporter, putative metabolite:H+ symporter